MFLAAVNTLEITGATTTEEETVPLKVKSLILIVPVEALAPKP